MLALRHGDTLAAQAALCSGARHYYARRATRPSAALILIRAYLGEILRHLTLVLAGVVFLLALGAAVKASSTAQGAPVWVALTLVPLFVGNALPYFFPVGLMTAVVLTYGRMAADREEVALRAAGCTPARLLLPALFAGLLLVLASYPLTSRIMPDIYRAMRELVVRSQIAAIENTNPGANEFHFQGLHLVWSDRERDGAFRDVVVAIDRETAVTGPQGEGAVQGGLRLRADRARMDVRDSELVFRFERLRTLSDESADSPWQARNTETTWLTINLESLLAAKGNQQRFRPKALSSRELKEYLAVPDGKNEGDLRKVELVYWQRWAGAWGAVPVALLGALIGWRLRRGGFLTGFATALGVLLAVNYPLHFLGEGLARGGAMPPSIAAWLPVIGLFIVVIGLGMRGRGT